MSSSSLSALEQNADRLFREKAKQATVHDQLDDNISELEREHRSLVFKAKDEVQAIQRKKEELAELRQENERLDREFNLSKTKYEAQLALTQQTVSAMNTTHDKIVEATNDWKTIPPQLISTIRTLEERRGAKEERQKLAHAIRDLLSTFAVVARKRHCCAIVDRLIAVIPTWSQSESTTSARVEELTTDLADKHKKVDLLAQENNELERQTTVSCTEAAMADERLAALAVTRSEISSTLLGRREALDLQDKALEAVKQEEIDISQRRAALQSQEIAARQELDAEANDVQIKKDGLNEELEATLARLKETEATHAQIAAQVQAATKSLDDAMSQLEQTKANHRYVVNIVRTAQTKRQQWRADEDALSDQLNDVQQKIKLLTDEKDVREEHTRRLRLQKHLAVLIDAAIGEETFTREGIAQAEHEAFDSLQQTAEETLKVLKDVQVIKQKRGNLEQHEARLRDSVEKQETAQRTHLLDQAASAAARLAQLQQSAGRRRFGSGASQAQSPVIDFEHRTSQRKTKRGTKRSARSQRAEEESNHSSPPQEEEEEDSFAAFFDEEPPIKASRTQAEPAAANSATKKTPQRKPAKRGGAVAQPKSAAKGSTAQKKFTLSQETSTSDGAESCNWLFAQPSAPSTAGKATSQRSRAATRPTPGSNESSAHKASLLATTQRRSTTATSAVPFVDEEESPNPREPTGNTPIGGARRRLVLPLVEDSEDDSFVGTPDVLKKTPAQTGRSGLKRFMEKTSATVPPSPGVLTHGRNGGKITPATTAAQQHSSHTTTTTTSNDKSSLSHQGKHYSNSQVSPNGPAIMGRQSSGVKKATRSGKGTSPSTQTAGPSDLFDDLFKF